MMRSSIIFKPANVLNTKTSLTVLLHYDTSKLNFLKKLYEFKFSVIWHNSCVYKLNLNVYI